MSNKGLRYLLGDSGFPDFHLHLAVLDITLPCSSDGGSQVLSAFMAPLPLHGGRRGRREKPIISGIPDGRGCFALLPLDSVLLQGLGFFPLLV